VAPIGKRPRWPFDYDAHLREVRGGSFWPRVRGWGQRFRLPAGKIGCSLHAEHTRGRSFIICSQRGGKFSRFYSRSLSLHHTYISFPFHSFISHLTLLWSLLAPTLSFLYTPTVKVVIPGGLSHLLRFATFLSSDLFHLHTTFLTLISKTYVLVTLSQHSVRSRIVHLNHFALSNRLLDSRFISHTREFQFSSKHICQVWDT
jgi:hypothetical protein